MVLTIALTTAQAALAQSFVVISDPPSALVEVGGFSRGSTPVRVTARRTTFYHGPDPVVIKVLGYGLDECIQTAGFAFGEQVPDTVSFNLRECPRKTDRAFLEGELDDKPERVSNPFLDYPDKLRSRRQNGETVVEVLIDAEGNVVQSSVKVVYSSDPGFEKPSMDAVRGSVFRPGRVDGKAVVTRAYIPMTFTVR